MVTHANGCEQGQFDDAHEGSHNTTEVPETALVSNDSERVEGRGSANYIDDPNLLEWSEEEDGEDDEDEDGIREEDFDDNRVDDEDWDVTERDFTKQYNRLRQHVAVRSGAAEGTQQATAKSTSAVAVLPAVNRPRRTGNAPTTQLSSSINHQDKTTTDQLASLSKYSGRLKHVHEPYRMGMGASVNRKGPSAHANLKDKADRATNEQVLDPRTRIILYKMIGRGLLQEINGCVSTGKEANVYHALSPEGKHLALKIYKTSILIFKDRDRYVSGEHRFRTGYSRHNPRKMVRVWAEKEMRNLKRLAVAGVPGPRPIEVRENVLVMEFLGDEEGWASPRLKDAKIPESEHPRLYQDLLLTVRRLFHECHLVHADLSEYNILYDANSLFIIDVSQSVEHDHPHAFDFLRKDIGNVEEFFSRRGVRTLGLRRAFDFVTRVRSSLLSELDSSVAEGESVSGGTNPLSKEKETLQRWLEMAETDGAERAEGVSNNESEVHASHEDAVFMRSFIPRNLNEVFDPERDVEVLTRGEGKKLIYADTIGLVHPTSALTNKSESTPRKEGTTSVRFVEDGIQDMSIGEDVTSKAESKEDVGEVVELEGEENSSDDDDDDESSTATDDEKFESSKSGEHKPHGHKHEDRELKRERKKAVKEEAREKRKHKMKKAEKKKKIKATRRS
ncbi:RIO1-domain-containing protein [Fomitiporia mediterranea MF3/22]|uniref:RIO1-domain-containing protein n=1 Tax=Fomitiporia mediterranea (strain MF3/22) TaxID=694068 RepID=UPI00044078DD|nr:RIO1-domain-containing protein [Fomitiporia mediterranea MF3/22]EJC98445.1 RIO1-domain-containing protein [Fomitiporia mediterranea MF3/22]